MLETALHAHPAARGAAHADDRGVVLPRHFGDAAREYRALREGAALVDLGFRTVVRAVGVDRVTFLQGMLSNDVAALRPGEGCAALLLTIQGRVVADVRVAATDETILLDVDVRARDAFVEALERLVGEQLAPYAHREIEVADVPVRVVRASEVGGPGMVLHVAAARAPALWDALVARGAEPCGMEALEGRRVEVGVPRVGLDMDLTVLALEVPVEDALSTTKGCYLGQEVVARGTARGHVNRGLVGLVIDGPVPPGGAPLVRDGKDVGRLTTVAYSFGLDAPAALGFVRREHWEPGTELRVPHGHAVTLARVAALPLA